jgi:hypothetical protein
MTGKQTRKQNRNVLRAYSLRLSVASSRRPRKPLLRMESHYEGSDGTLSDYPAITHGIDHAGADGGLEGGGGDGSGDGEGGGGFVHAQAAGYIKIDVCLVQADAGSGFQDRSGRGGRRLAAAGGFADTWVAADQNGGGRTRPPPSTRSSSARPMTGRGSGSAVPARPTKAIRGQLALWPPDRGGRRRLLAWVWIRRVRRWGVPVGGLLAGKCLFRRVLSTQRPWRTWRSRWRLRCEAGDEVGDVADFFHVQAVGG